VGVGSVLLIPELLSKPLRAESPSDVAALASLLGRLDLRPVDHSTAELAAALGASIDCAPLMRFTSPPRLPPVPTGS